MDKEKYERMLQYVKEHPDATFDYGFMNMLFQFAKALIKKLEDNGIKPQENKMITLEEIKEKVFEQTIGSNRREYTGRNLCWEDSEEYLKECVRDLKKKHEELYPNINYKATLIKNEPLDMFVVLYIVNLEDGVHYVFQNFHVTPEDVQVYAFQKVEV